MLGGAEEYMSLHYTNVLEPRASSGSLTLRLTAGQEEWARHEGDPGATLFHSWRWLSWVAPLLDCRFVPLLVELDGASVGVAPLLLRRRAAWYTANLVPFPFLGPVVPPSLLAETLSMLQGWTKRHRVGSIELAVHPEALAPGLPLPQTSWPVRLEPTYLVDLAGKTLDQVFASFHGDARSAIRRSVKRGVTVRAATAEEIRTLLPAIHEQSLEAHKPYAYKLAASLALGQQPFPTRCTTAVVDGRPVGLSVAVRGANAMGWLGGVFREDQHTQANAALVWDAIQWAHAEGCGWLDMGGAPDPGIAAYKRKFKPRVEQHLLATWQSPTFVGLQRLRTTAGRAASKVRSLR
jgi:hypothetical protein